MTDLKLKADIGPEPEKHVGHTITGDAWAADFKGRKLAGNAWCATCGEPVRMDVIRTGIFTQADLQKLRAERLKAEKP